MKEIGTKGSTDECSVYLGLAVWITTVATVAWLMLWFLSGEPWSSFLAIVAPMALFAARTPAK